MKWELICGFNGRGFRVTCADIDKSGSVCALTFVRTAVRGSVKFSY